MSLPRAARERLAQPLRDAVRFTRPLRTMHTVPVGDWAWSQHVDALAEALEALATLSPEPPTDFNQAQDWVSRLLEARGSVISCVLPLEPFVPFDTDRAHEVLSMMDALPGAAVEALVGTAALDMRAHDLQTQASFWRGCEASAGSQRELLRAAFDMQDAPVDEQGEFRADWVLQHYPYEPGLLTQQVLPHLLSLGMVGVADVLAAISVVGWVLDCDDPVVAYIHLDSFVSEFYAASPGVARDVIAHLDEREPALRRNRSTVNRALAVASEQSTATEPRALALVDAYTRLLEGSFRQLSWALHSLQVNEWEHPPMLTSLRERLMAGQGNLGQIAREVILPDLRNSEAHETLEWDGFLEEFVTEAGRVRPDHVALALSLADSFVHGCEAGAVAVRSLGTELDGDLPTPEQVGRMPNWRRVRGYFGTNRLRLMQAELNTRNATLQVQRLAFTDINPCFQALLLAHRLLPDIETFAVSTPASEAPVIQVSSAALDAAMPAWECAVTTVNVMPIATFLAVNWDARRRHETEPIATRSVAWLAVDDLLDALDGSPEEWNDEVVHLLQSRFSIVELSARSVGELLGIRDVRIESVQASATELRLWLESSEKPNPASADRHVVVVRLRTQWARWGPVARHPLILQSDAPDISERRPALHEPGMRFRTL